MVCKDIQKHLAEYSDNQLSYGLQQQVQSHLENCEVCAKELKAYQSSWDMLDVYKVDALPGGYESRFWTRLTQEQQKPKPDRIFVPKPWALSTVALSVLLILGVSTHLEHSSLDDKLSKMSPDEVEMIKNMDLAQYWQGIEHMDVLKDMDVIEQTDFEGET